MSSPVRSCLSIFIAALLFMPPAFALDTPLSDQAIRQAYFLGQRHDASADSLGQYSKQLPVPKSGPHISSIEFFTPFAQLIRQSATHSGDYSAQQALLDHRGQPEFVKVFVRIRLTPSYSAILSLKESKDKSSPPQIVRRPYDFWKDFQVQVSGGNQPLSPSSVQGTRDSSCGRRGPCSLFGATIELQFPAGSFTSDIATILVTPPEGDPVSVDFNLISLR